MRAAVLTEINKPLQILDLEQEPPRAGEVRVRVKADGAWRMHDGTVRIKLNGEPVNQMARIGTFSEQVVCPAEQLVKIRHDLPSSHAAIIGCSVATGIGAVIRHARVPAGSSVLVIGCGGVGLNVVQGARLAGASPIIACDFA